MHDSRVTLKTLLRLTWSSFLLGLLAAVLLLCLGAPAAHAALATLVGTCGAVVGLTTFAIASLLRVLTSLYVMLEADWVRILRDGPVDPEVRDVTASEDR